jgi:hypothetical protein
VTEYPPTGNGNIAPSVTIAGPATGFSFPDGIDVDSFGHLFVANQFAGSVTEFAADASGNAAPLATITGPATGLSAPGRLAVSPPLSVRTHALPTATTGRSYAGHLLAGLGTSPYVWSIVKGRLPAGLHLDARTGLVHGRTHHAGTFRFTVRVVDSTRPHMHATARVTLKVHAARRR